MLRIAMNVILNERSRREFPRADVNLAESVPGLETPEAELTKSEAAALRLVQSNHRAAVVLRDLEGLTYRDTASESRGRSPRAKRIGVATSLLAEGRASNSSTRRAP
jgi:RNA polymerase sigma-70 factor (ECF subfamily)